MGGHLEIWPYRPRRRRRRRGTPLRRPTACRERRYAAAARARDAETRRISPNHDAPASRRGPLSLTFSFPSLWPRSLREWVPVPSAFVRTIPGHHPDQLESPKTGSGSPTDHLFHSNSVFFFVQRESLVRELVLSLTMAGRERDALDELELCGSPYLRFFPTE